MGEMERETKLSSSLARRPYYYATGMDGAVHAYTREEWGIGGAKPSGNAYGSFTVTGRAIVAALMTIPAVVSPLMLVRGVVGLHLGVVLVSLVATVLFTGGWALCVHSLIGEFSAGKFRRAKGLPKPRFSVTDDQALAWFDVNAGGPEVTRANFPDASRPL